MILEGLAEVDENSFKNMIKRRDAQVAELRMTVIQKDKEINQKDEENTELKQAVNKKDEEIASLRRLLEEAGINT